MSIIVRLILCAAGTGLMGFLAVNGGYDGKPRWNELPFGLWIGFILSVVILFVVPWVFGMAWRFLLRRVEELGRAIRGRS